MASPLDLPQMWQKPGYEALLDTLNGLALSPPVWGLDDGPAGESLASQRRGDTTRYLSSIVKSPLAWIADEAQRERLWELASRRMSERCGRAAMGDVVRRWPLPERGLELAIREPALTGDALGLKTWAASYLLARRLPRLAAASLFRLFDETLGQPPPRVLELGAGTGLLGLAAAALWKAPVALSDVPAIVPNLRHNAAENAARVRACGGGAVAVGPLVWGAEGGAGVDARLFGAPFQFKIVLAADPLYDDHHPGLLAAAVARHLALGPEARAVVAVPRRDGATERLLGAFRRAMADREDPLVCEDEDELDGRDDWGDGGEAARVRCWLSVFSRGGTPPSGC